MDKEQRRKNKIEWYKWHPELKRASYQRRRDRFLAAPPLLPDNKTCSGCKESLPASEFWKRPVADGLTPQCKPCSNLEKKRRRLANYAHHKNLDVINREKNHAKILVRKREAWKSMDPEKKALYRRIGRNARRSRLRGSDGTVTKKEWIKLVEQYCYTCLCCNRKFSQVELCMDHIRPLAKGGAHSISNIQPLCIPCNVKKSTKTIDYRLGAELMGHWLSQGGA